MKRSGGARWVRGKPYARVRIGKGRRVTAPLTGIRSREDADERADAIAAVAQVLIDAGRWFDVGDVARAMGAAKTEAELRVLRRAAEKMSTMGPKIIDGDVDFETFADRWTSGELARLFPDHVKAKNHQGDIGIIKLYIRDLVGRIPLRAFTLEHADAVMGALPPSCGKSRRRHVAQVIHRVLAIAAYPAKLIPATPLPKGWLPKLGKPKAFAYLYPTEDAQVLACTNIPLDFRMLYGVLNREGMRVGEAIALDWSDLELDIGHLSLDENKTDDPRGWSMDRGVKRALEGYKKIVGRTGSGPFKNVPTHSAAVRMRADLKLAGLDRVKLFERSEKRQPLRIHDLRATFVTLSLANGKTETWVADRTGHKSSTMIAKYKRAARAAEELNLGPLLPLDEAIPELRGGAQVGQQARRIQFHVRKGKRLVLKEVAPAGLEPARPIRARDFKSAGTVSTGAEGLENGCGRGKKALAKTGAPQAAPHPGPTWRGVADAYDGISVAEDEEAGA